MTTIAVIESAYRTKNHYLFKTFCGALKRSKGFSRVIVLDYANALSILSNSLVDILFVFGGEESDDVIFDILRSKSKISIIWFLEDPYEYDRNLQVSRKFDIVFTNDKKCSKGYGDNSFHLPLAGDPEFAETGIKYSRRRYDISFIGTLWPNRAEFLSEAQFTLASLKSKLIISENIYLEPFLKNFKVNIQKTDGVDFSDFMRISSSSRLSLMIDRQFSSNQQHQISDTPGPRFFESSIAGSALLVDRRVSGDLTYLGFQSDVDYFSFNNLREFNYIIDNYKRHIEEFEKVAKSAQIKTILNHTYDVRVLQILEILKKYKDAQIIHFETKAITNTQYAEKINSDNVSFLESTSKNSTILIISHSKIFGKRIGGSEIYMQNFIKLLRDHQIFILEHDDIAGFGIKYNLLDSNGNELNSYVMDYAYSDLMLKHNGVENVFLSACEKTKPNIVIFNHFIGFPPSIGLLCKYLGLPYIVVLHDYYTVCDQFNLIASYDGFCKIDTIDANICDACTYKRRGIIENSQSKRRNYFTHVLLNASALVANTQGFYDITSLINGLNHEKSYVIQPPITFKFSSVNTIKKPNFKPENQLNIAIMGNLAPNKGLKDLVYILEATKSEDLHFHVFGRVDWSDHLKKIKNFKNVSFYGSYNHDDFPDEVSSCDIALFLSKWPETYCMTLTEVISHRVVPICYNIGAFRERISNDFGYLIDPNPGAVVDLLRQLMSNMDEIKIKKSNLNDRLPIVSNFDKEYSKLIDEYSVHPSPLQYFKIEKFDQSKILLNWVSSRWDRPFTKEAHLPSVQTRSRNDSKSIIGIYRQVDFRLILKGYNYLKIHGMLPTIIKTRNWLITRI